MEKKLERMKGEGLGGRAQQQVVADLKKEIAAAMAAAQKVSVGAGLTLRRQ